MLKHWLPSYSHIRFNKDHLFVFPGGSVVKNPPANARDGGDACSVPELG